MRNLGGFRQKVMGSQKAIRLHPLGNNNTQSRFNENPAFIFGTLERNFSLHQSNMLHTQVMVSGRVSSSVEHRFLLQIMHSSFNIAYVAALICSNCGVKRKRLDSSSVDHDSMANSYKIKSLGVSDPIFSQVGLWIVVSQNSV